MTDLTQSIISGLTEASATERADLVAAATHGRITVDDTRGRIYLEAPYDPARVDAVRRIPGRRWNGTRDEFPLDALADVIDVCRRFGVHGWEPYAERASAAAARAAQRIEASSATDAALVIPGLAGDLLPFQRAGVRYALDTRRTLIADEMGLGKTVQALATLEAAGAFPALVVCPAALKVNWQREAARWLPHRTTDVLVGKKADHALQADITIVNYDILSAWEAAVGTPAALVLDESHLVKSTSAARTKAARAIAGRIPADGVVLLLTGTPVLNRADELVAQLTVLGRLNAFGGAKGFRNQFCAWDGYSYRGSRNTDTLHRRLRETCMVRRVKADVLTELPAKRRAEQWVELGGDARARYNEAEADLVRFLADEAAFMAERIGEDPTEAGRRKAAAAMRAEAIVRLTTLRRVCGEGKVDHAVRWVTEFLDTGKKVVVFAHHREVVNALADAFGAPKIQGGQTAEQRQAAVDAFQGDENVRVIVCAIQAAGVGLTLTAASDVLFVERAWTPAAIAQAEDRCHRIGQTDSVTAWNLAAVDTIDERVEEMLAEKMVVVDAITDGTDTDTEDGSITDAILGGFRY